jgi:hypothetical protein
MGLWPHPDNHSEGYTCKQTRTSIKNRGEQTVTLIYANFNLALVYQAGFWVHVRVKCTRNVSQYGGQQQGFASNTSIWFLGLVERIPAHLNRQTGVCERNVPGEVGAEMKT